MKTGKPYECFTLTEDGIISTMNMRAHKYRQISKDASTDVDLILDKPKLNIDEWNKQTNITELIGGEKIYDLQCDDSGYVLFIVGS